MKAELIELIRTYSYREGTFKLASGLESPYYVDMRKTALTARGGYLIGELLLDQLEELGWHPAAVGGMVLGAAPLTTAVCLQSLRRPGGTLASFLVRKAPKGHGTASQIETSGDMKPNAPVVVVEDTTTTGGSALQAVQVLRDNGYQVLGVLSVVDRLEGASEAFEQANLPFHALLSVEDLQA